MRHVKAVLTIALLIGALPIFGAGYIKFDGIDGESAAEGHKQWIEILSTQFAEGSCGTARVERVRQVIFTSRSVPEALIQACQTGRKFSKVLVEVDGQRHVLENATLSNCPTSRTIPTGTVTFRIDYANCATHWPQKVEIGALKAGSSEAATRRGNAAILGLTPAAVEMTVKSASLAGNTATMTLVSGTVQKTLGAAISQATALGSTIGTIVIKSTNGQQWSFSKVMFTSASFPGDQPPSFTFQFESMTGSAATFQMLGN